MLVFSTDARWAAAGRHLAPAAVLLSLLLSACTKEDKPTVPAPLVAPAAVTFTQAGLYPEGVQYDAANTRFLVSSLTTGLIGQVKDNGAYTLAFISDPRVVSAIGLHLDESRNRVLVAVADPGANPARTTTATLRNLAQLAIYNRSSPETPPVVVELGARAPAYPNHFANDIAVDKQGNVYVTDSFAPIIYKVDAVTNTASVFLEDAHLGTSNVGAFGLNGLVFHPDGYLLVAKSDVGALYKVPLDNPAGFTQVATSQNLQGADGLLLQDNTTLQVVCNAQAKVYRLATTNGFTTATTSGQFSTQAKFPTTLTRREGFSYVLYANLNALFAMPAQSPAVSEYSINRVEFLPPPTPTPAPATIAFTQAGLYPEGVQYDAAYDRFLVTSLTTGKIGQVKDDGTYSLFADDPRLVSAIGLHLDEARNRVLVAVSDQGANMQRTTPATRRNLARLAIFNRSSPQTAPVVVELGTLRPTTTYPNHFANDIAVDAQGNAYVTDSSAPIIYKVDAMTNVATVFLEDAQLGAPAPMFGLNGIVFHPDGYLLVAKSNEGVLFKVPLSNPSSFSRVTTTQNLQGADGLLLQDNNTLQVVCNGQAKVYRLASTNGFAAATLSGTFSTQPVSPTTLARRDGASYVLFSNLNALNEMPPRNPPVSQFSINRVSF